MRRITYVTAAVTTAAALLLAGCGGAGDQTPPAPQVSSATTESAAPSASALTPEDHVKRDLEAAGFTVLSVSDVTPEGSGSSVSARVRVTFPGCEGDGRFFEAWSPAGRFMLVGTEVVDGHLEEAFVGTPTNLTRAQGRALCKYGEKK
jgi:hypothetical protein